MHSRDEEYLRIAFAAARSARHKGNHPFGAVLVDDLGNILLEAENAVVTTGDCTAHAETALIKAASMKYDRQFLTRCTIYASTEPCPMCAGAIFWANIGRVVYGLSEEGLYALTGDAAGEVLYLPCREILGKGNKVVEVVGPLLEDEARQVHAGFLIA